MSGMEARPDADVHREVVRTQVDAFRHGTAVHAEDPTEPADREGEKELQFSPETAVAIDRSPA